MAQQPGEIERSEFEALLATRRELGQDYDAALVDSFADRIEKAVGDRVAALGVEGTASGRLQVQLAKQQFTLGVVSIACGIPITAISAGIAQLPGLAVAWLGIVGVNVAHALQGRRRR
jgi:hypothetical protein